MQFLKIVLIPENQMEVFVVVLLQFNYFLWEGVIPFAKCEKLCNSNRERNVPSQSYDSDKAKTGEGKLIYKIIDVPQQFHRAKVLLLTQAPGPNVQSHSYYSHLPKLSFQHQLLCFPSHPAFVLPTQHNCCSPLSS